MIKSSIIAYFVVIYDDKPTYSAFSCGLVRGHRNVKTA